MNSLVESERSLTASITKGADLAFVMSSGTPDRVQDTIDPAAYSPNLGKRLIALWQHDHAKPVGYWDDLKVQGKRLVGRLTLAGTELAKMVRELLDADVPLGASIGFRGAGKLNDEGGIHFKTIELLECSIVSVPAHPEAMRIAKAFHLEHLLPQASGSRRAASGHNPAQADTIVRAKAAILSANRTLRKKP